MKKAFCTGTLAVSLLLGAARAADLFLNTDTATGFLLSGSVWTRYWLMAPVVILAWLAGLYVPRKQPCGLRPGAGVWMSGVNFVFVPLAFCSELYGFLTVLNVLFGTPEQAGRHQTAERILLELRDKVKNEELSEQLQQVGAVGEQVASGTGNVAEAVSALVVLGYSQSEAARAVAGQPPEASVQELIKVGLKKLSGAR